MGKSLNKVILIGTVVRDPDLRFTSSGTAVCDMTVVTNDNYKDKNGEWQEASEFHKVVIWARTAEVAGEYVNKGDKIAIEGSLQTDKWTDKEGNDRYTTKIKCFNMILLGGKSKDAKPIDDKQEYKKPDQEDIPF